MSTLSTLTTLSISTITVLVLIIIWLPLCYVVIAPRIIRWIDRSRTSRMSRVGYDGSRRAPACAPRRGSQSSSQSVIQSDSPLVTQTPPYNCYTAEVCWICKRQMLPGQSFEVSGGFRVHPSCAKWLAEAIRE